MTVQPGPGSRYRTVTDLRPRPPTDGVVEHVLRAGERLDQLASDYYGRPEDWWRICDANPDVLSPLALVGADPVTATTVALSGPDAPPWHRLLRALSALDGVLAVQVVDGPAGRALVVTHNRVEADADAVAQAVLAIAPIGPVQRSTAAGREIAVPPPAQGAEEP